MEMEPVFIAPQGPRGYLRHHDRAAAAGLYYFAGAAFEGGRALAYYNQSKRVMAMACERATKPTRTFTLSDEVRRANVAAAFDAMIQSTKQKVLSRDVQVKWTETKINAEFSYGLIFSEMFNLEKLKYRLDESCEGIPPYPEDDAVIIDNMFESNASASSGF